MGSEGIQWIFSNISSGQDYFSIKIEPTSLAGLQQLTEFFLGDITRNHDVLPKSISDHLQNNATAFNDAVSSFQSHWQEILSSNGLFLSMFLIGIIVAVLLPICGIIAGIKHFCCSCLKKKPKPARKNAKDIFRLQGFTALFLLAMGWIGVAWLNTSNLALDRGINRLPNNTKGILEDSRLYLDSIDKQIGRNIDEVLEHLDEEFTKWEKQVNRTLQNEVKNAKFDEILSLSKFVLNVLSNFFESNKTQISNQLNSITNDIKNIKKSVNTIDQEVKTVSNDATCKINKECTESTTKLINIIIEFNAAIKTYDIIHDTSKEIESISDDSQVVDLDNWLSNKSTDKMYEFFMSNLNQKIHEYREKPKEFGSSIKENISPVFEKINSFNGTMQDGIQGLSKFVSEYAKIVYQIFLAASIVIAVVLLLSSLGLIFGVCNFGTCPSKSAPKLLNGSTLIILFIGPILWVMTSGLFFVGGITDKLICQTLQDPQNAESVLYNSINTVLNRTLVENLLSKHSSNNSFKIDSLLESCEKGHGLLKVFHIDVDLIEILSSQGNFSKKEIKSKLDELVDEGINTVVEKIELKPEMENYMNDIGKNVMENFLENNGSNFHKALTQNISKELKREEFLAVKNDFEPFRSIPRIDSLINELNNVDNITQNELLPRLEDTRLFFKEYNRSLFYNSTCSLICATNQIKALIEVARKYIDENTRNNAKKEVNDLVTTLIRLITRFELHLTNEFASCKPVYDIYHGITVTLCDNLINPLNGIWTSLGMALFFLLPSLVLFKLMVTYLGKPKYKPVSNDEEDDDVNGLSRYQDRRVHMRELRRNESFRRLQRATSREN